ncbi:thiamine pyrophosphate-dependent enzyme [Chloroflexota bacterium]
MSEAGSGRLVRDWPKLFLRTAVALCPGCQHGVAMRLLCEVLEDLNIQTRTVGVYGVTCGAIASTLVQIDWLMSAHGRACDAATAIKRVSRGELVTFTWQGDGDALAIGTESTIQAAARGEKITVIMINNLNYGATGGQMAPTTLLGQTTTTTPRGREVNREGYPFRGPEYMAVMDGVAYAARGAVNTPANCERTKKYMRTALQKQIDNIGFSYVEVLSACPPDWHLSPVECLDRIANEVIPVYTIGEFKNVT